MSIEYKEVSIKIEGAKSLEEIPEEKDDGFFFRKYLKALRRFENGALTCDYWLQAKGLSFLYEYKYIIFNEKNISTFFEYQMPRYFVDVLNITEEEDSDQRYICMVLEILEIGSEISILMCNELVKNGIIILFCSNLHLYYEESIARVISIIKHLCKNSRKNLIQGCIQYIVRIAQMLYHGEFPSIVNIEGIELLSECCFIGFNDSTVLHESMDFIFSILEGKEQIWIKPALRSLYYILLKSPLVWKSERVCFIEKYLIGSIIFSPPDRLFYILHCLRLFIENNRTDTIISLLPYKEITNNLESSIDYIQDSTLDLLFQMSKKHEFLFGSLTDSGLIEKCFHILESTSFQFQEKAMAILCLLFVNGDQNVKERILNEGMNPSLAFDYLESSKFTIEIIHCIIELSRVSEDFQNYIANDPEFLNSLNSIEDEKNREMAISLLFGNNE